MKKNRAVFLDRDGVINELVYYRELGIVDSPFTRHQMRLLPKAAQAIRRLNRMQFKVIVVSNQPGIAKGHFTKTSLSEMTNCLKELLYKKGAFLNGIYYCLHHPRAKIKSLRKRCSCRKPKSGMLKKAARDFNIDLKKSYLIGDDLSDIKAGKEVGCKTFLIGPSRCDHCRLRQEHGIELEFIVPNLLEAVKLLNARR